MHAVSLKKLHGGIPDGKADLGAHSLNLITQLSSMLGLSTRNELAEHIRARAVPRRWARRRRQGKLGPRSRAPARGSQQPVADESSGFFEGRPRAGGSGRCDRGGAVDAEVVGAVDVRVGAV